MSKAKSKGLGRGFGSLIPTDIIKNEFDPTRDHDAGKSSPAEVLIQDITPGDEQPRSVFKEAALKELEESIKTHGVIQPIILVKEGGSYRIIAGERRWRAAKAAGLSTIPAIVRSMDGQTRLEVALIENVQREDLSPLEMATAILKLQSQFNMSIGAISKRVGKAESTVSNVKRLLKLPEPAKQALSDLQITEQHARAILALDGDSKKQNELLDLIIKHSWTARRSEQFVTAYKNGAATPTEAVKRIATVDDDTKRISKKIKAPVKIRRMAKGGRLIIEFKDDKDYARISGLLS